MAKDIKQEVTSKDEPTGDAAASSGGVLLARLKAMGVKAARNTATILAIMGIVISLISMYMVKVSQAKLVETSAKIDDLSARLASSKVAFEKYQAVALQEKTLQNEERKKLDDLDRKIIQSVSQQQVKMKISPTLEEMLKASETVPPASSVEAVKTLSVPAVPSVTSEQKQASEPEKPSKKMSPQAQAIQGAIQKFNSK